MVMRPPLCFFSLLFPFLLLTCNSAFSQEILVVAKYDNEPLSYEHEGEMQGIAFLMFSRICKELKLPFTVKRIGPLPWKRVLLYLKTNQVDVFLGSEKLDDKNNQLIFSKEPLYQTSHSVFYRRTDPVTMDSLHSLSGSVMEDMRLDLLANESGLNLNLNQSYSRKQNLAKLMNRRVDYIIAPLLPTLNYISKSRLEVIDEIAFLKKPIVVSSNYLLYAPQSPLLEYKDKIDEKLREYQNNGTIDSAIGKEIANWKAFDWYLENFRGASAPPLQPVRD